MISDVLSESLAKIEEYQSQFTGSYEDTRDEIEQVKRAMTRLLIRLDAPPEMTPESWAEGMIRLAETDPIRLKELMANRVYRARREQVSEFLGQDHTLVLKLAQVEREAAIT